MPVNGKPGAASSSTATDDKRRNTSSGGSAQTSVTRKDYVTKHNSMTELQSKKMNNKVSVRIGHAASSYWDSLLGNDIYRYDRSSSSRGTRGTKVQKNLDWRTNDAAWRKEWRGIHLPPSVFASDRSGRGVDDTTVDDVVKAAVKVVQQVVAQAEAAPREVPILEPPRVERVQLKTVEKTVSKPRTPLPKVPSQPKIHQHNVASSQQSTTPSSMFDFGSSPSIPLYPLLLAIVTYHLLNKLLRRIFSFQKRIRMKRKVDGILAQHKQFFLSQEELSQHIDYLSKRNEKKRAKDGKTGDQCGNGTGSHDRRDEGGDDGAGGGSGNGDAAGGYQGGSAGSNGYLRSNSIISGGGGGTQVNGNSLAKDAHLNSIRITISESPKQLKGEKEELIQQRGLLHERDSSMCEKEVLMSEKKLFVKWMAEKDEEFQHALLVNKELKKKVERLASECVGARTTSKDLAEQLTQTKKDKDALIAALEARTSSHATSITNFKALLRESDAKVSKLTDDNYILKKVIERLEEENNEMELAIEEACMSEDKDLDIEGVDLEFQSRGSLDMESLTRDDDSFSGSEFKRREEKNALLRSEKETLEKAVSELQQMLDEAKLDVDRLMVEIDASNGERQRVSNDLTQLKLEYNAVNEKYIAVHEKLDSLEQEKEKWPSMHDMETMATEESFESISTHCTIESLRSEKDELRKSLVEKEEAILILRRQKEELQASLDGKELAFETTIAENNTLQKSLEVTCNRFTALLEDKEFLQKSLRKERKAIADCVKSLESARVYATILITDLQTEVKKAHGSLPKVSEECLSESENSASSVDKGSDRRQMTKSASTLLKQLNEIKELKQQLVMTIQRKIWDVLVSTELVGVKQLNLGFATLTEQNVFLQNSEQLEDNATNSSTDPSEDSSEVEIIHQLLECAQTTRKGAKSSRLNSDLKKLMSSLECELNEVHGEEVVTARKLKTSKMRRLWKQRRAAAVAKT